MNEAASEHKKRASEATSSGSPTLPIGCVFASSSNISCSRVHTTFVDGYLKKNYPGEHFWWRTGICHEFPYGQIVDHPGAKIATRPRSICYVCNSRGFHI